MEKGCAVDVGTRGEMAGSHPLFSWDEDKHQCVVGSSKQTLNEKRTRKERSAQSSVLKTREEKTQCAREGIQINSTGSPIGALHRGK